MCRSEKMEKEIQISESRLKYEHYAHSVGMVMLHLQWCTKYRYKMFWWRSNIKLIEACIRRSASKNGIKIIELNVQPEHIHCVVMVRFSLSTSKVLQLLKGGSSRLFFEHQKKARLRYPRGHLWSRGKFVSSVGFVDLGVVQNYVRTQDERY